MALAGLHIACVDLSTKYRTPVVTGIRFSETMASAGTTTAAAPATGDATRPAFQFRAAADSFVAIGPTPNAASGEPRLFIPTGETVTVACKAGDKVAWVAA